MKQMDKDTVTEKLAEQSVDIYSSDSHALFMLILEGCRGYNNLSNEELEKEYEDMFGEEIKIKD